MKKIAFFLEITCHQKAKLYADFQFTDFSYRRRCYTAQGRKSDNVSEVRRTQEKLIIFVVVDYIENVESNW